MPPGDPARVQAIEDILATEATALSRKAQLERVKAWETRFQEDWKRKRTEVYKWVRDSPHTRTAFLRREDGSLTADPAEVQQIAQQAWMSKIYCTPGRRRVDEDEVVWKYAPPPPA